MVERWFLLSPEPIVIIDDRTLEILGANRAAEAMLRNSNFIRDVDGALTFADTRQTDDFRRQIQAHGQDAAAICLRRDDGGDVLVARVEHPSPDDQAHTATVIFQGHIGGSEVGVGRTLWAPLCKAFELTPAEERVAKQLVTGDSVAAIAKRLSITVDTLRSHAQRIYIKVGVANREQLMTRLAPFRFAGASPAANELAEDAA